jgi:hypothetical protein
VLVVLGQDVVRLALELPPHVTLLGGAFW